VKRNDELSMELLKIVNMQLARLEHSDSTAAERARITAVITELTHRVSVD